MISILTVFALVGGLLASSDLGPASGRARADIDLFKWADVHRKAPVITGTLDGGVALGPEIYGELLLRLDSEFVYRCSRETPAATWHCDQIDRAWGRGPRFPQSQGRGST